MRRLLLFVLFAGLAAAATVAFASAAGSGSTQPRLSPTTESLQSFLPTGVIPAGTDWASPRGDAAQTQFSTLNQITPANVAKLHVVWRGSYNGNDYGGGLGVEGVPLFISGKNKNLPLEDGTMFLSAANGMVAINPKDGSIIWKYVGPPTKVGLPNAPAGQSSRTEEYGRGRIYVGQQDGSIAAIDAKTGHLVWSVDTSGEGTFPGKSFTAAPPSAFYDDGKDGLVFYGGGSGGSSPIRGHMDAFNAKTGALAWRFWNTPDPNEQPFILTWGNPAEAAWGGANNWGSFAIDPQVPTLYYGTGNSAPYTGRAPGKDLWVASMMAVNPNTGTLRWYYQTVHHDEWDSDLPNPPALFNATINGKVTPAIVFGTKAGYIFELNRRNGHPIFPIPEVKIPDPFGTAALNNTYATQPEPTGGAAQTTPHCLTQAQISQLYPAFGNPPMAPNGTPIVGSCNYVPTTNTQYSAFTGDELGSISLWPNSYDPLTKDYYVCSRMSLYMLENKSPNDYHLLAIEGEPTQGTVGYVTALNMTTNKVDWQVQWPASVGSCRAGVLSTASGLVFAASWGDTTRGDPASIPLSQPAYGGWLYAFDAKTGKQLWSWQAPDYVHAPPITFMWHGKQYLAWYLGGPAANNPRHSSDVTGQGDQLTVFSL